MYSLKILKWEDSVILPMDFVKFRDILQLQTLRTIYFAFYQPIFQYGLLLWGSIREYFFKSLQINQKHVLRLILDKTSLKGSTKYNYTNFGILLIGRFW